MRWAWFVILAASATMAPAKTPTNLADKLNLMTPGDRLDKLDGSATDSRLAIELASTRHCLETPKVA